MLDIKWIRENPEAFNVAMKNRGNKITAENILNPDKERREIITQIQQKQSERNLKIKEIAEIKKNKGNADLLIEESKKINQQLAELEKLQEKFKSEESKWGLIAEIPNIPESSVPVGKSEEDNLEVEKWGEIPKFNFIPKQHFEIGEGLNLLDFEQSVLMSGSRFSTLFGNIAKLERALSNFMLDVAGEFGYTEISPPNLVKEEAMFRSGQLPKFAAEAFHTTGGYWLIPTSEVSLVNLAAQKTFNEEELPLRFTAYTPCFRSEAGAAGKDTRGMIRQHQFKKVELVSITTSESSKDEHERMTNISCEILKRLKLPFRKVLLCTGDMGFCSQKTYDLEVWLAGQNKYREISSCSNCGDFQGRRLESKYKTKDGKSYFIHTLNGSSLAVGRTIIAILENYQNEDGSVNIPDVLINYMGAIRKI